MGEVLKFPGRLVRIPPRVLGVYEGGTCKLVSVRNGLIEIETIVCGQVTRMWVSAEHVRLFEEVRSVMAGHDPRPSDGAA